MRCPWKIPCATPAWGAWSLLTMSHPSRTECVGHPAVTLGDEARPQLHLLVQMGNFVWCCVCEARAAKFAKKRGEPCLGRPRTQEYARSMRLLLTGWHSKESRFLGSCSPRKHGQSGDGTIKESTWPKLEGASSDRRSAAPVRHLLLVTGEIKWCWKCGARVKKDSAPRLPLKTACSGAPRTKECERALFLLAKGEHPKSSVFVGLPSHIRDEEWSAWVERHGSLPYLLA